MNTNEIVKLRPGNRWQVTSKRFLRVCGPFCAGSNLAFQLRPQLCKWLNAENNVAEWQTCTKLTMLDSYRKLIVKNLLAILL